MGDTITKGQVRRKHIVDEVMHVVEVGPLNVVIENEIGVFSVAPVKGFWDRFEAVK